MKRLMESWKFYRKREYKNMKEQEYKFVGKTTEFKTIATEWGTVQEIYENLVKSDIVYHDTIEDYIVENYFSRAERECYNALLDYYENEGCEDDLWDLLNDRISELEVDLNKDDMKAIITKNKSNMYYQEWIELED